MWIWGFSVEVCWELCLLMFDEWICHAYYSAMSGSFVYGMLIFLCWPGERVINILLSDLRKSKPLRGLFKDFLSQDWNRYLTSFTMIAGTLIVLDWSREDDAIWSKLLNMHGSNWVFLVNCFCNDWSVNLVLNEGWQHYHKNIKSWV